LVLDFDLHLSPEHIDVLVIRSQDCLQLLLEGVRHSDVIIFFYLLNHRIFT
jgi:hypothetical protein